MMNWAMGMTHKITWKHPEAKTEHMLKSSGASADVRSVWHQFLPTTTHGGLGLRMCRIVSVSGIVTNDNFKRKRHRSSSSVHNNHNTAHRKLSGRWYLKTSVTIFSWYMKYQQRHCSIILGKFHVIFFNNYTSVNMNSRSKSDQITKQTLNWAIFTGKTFWDELVVNNGKNVVKVMLYLLESLFLQPCLWKLEEHLGIKKISRHLNTGLDLRIQWLFFSWFLFSFLILCSFVFSQQT